jgi:thiamine biosynthesis lipoprotein
MHGGVLARCARAVAIASISSASMLGACAAPRLERHEYSEPHMGTTFRIVLYAPSASAADRAAAEAFRRIAELDAAMSDYDAASELSRLSALSTASAPTEPVHVSRDLWSVLVRARDVSRMSEGAFDVTAGPLTALWRRARRQHELPSDESLANALRGVGWRNLELDESARTARLLARDMRLDLGGIAKGFAADAALDVLCAAGLDRSLIAAGGDVRAGRAPPGSRGWTIALEPFGPSGAASAIELEQAAVSTSGDAEQALELDGMRYSHIVDPRTGRALAHRIAASVIAGESTTADALATAACVLGRERGIELVGRFDGARARITTLEGGRLESSESPGFASSMLRSPARDLPHATTSDSKP